MEQNFNETMHSPKKISLLIMLSEIVGWVMLVLYILSFISDLQSLIPNFSQFWPQGNVMEQVMTIAGLLFKPAIGLFYFAMLHGVAQLLALGVDLFFNTDLEFEEVVEEYQADENEEDKEA